MSEPRPFRPVQFWGDAKMKLTVHPECEKYPKTPTVIKEDIKADMKEHGYDTHFPIILDHKKQIVAGRCRYECCEELGIEFVFSNLRDGEDIPEFCFREQDNRKHLTEQFQERRRRERIDRVVESRQAGKSIRTIAEEEEVSPAQVQRDLEKASGVPGGTVEPESGKVKGKDDKEHPAIKPKILCPHCQGLLRKNLKPLSKCEQCKALRKPKKKKPKLTLPDDSPPVDREAGCEETVKETMERVNKEIESFCRNLTALADQVPQDEWLNDMGRLTGFKQKIKDACGSLRSGKCHSICPICKGEDKKKCRPCHDTGRMPKQNHDQAI